MLTQVIGEIEVATPGRGFTEITGRLTAFLATSGIRSGLLTVHLEHTSASLIIQENADPVVRSDLERFFARWIPDGDPAFEHRAEGPDDMPAHLRSAVTAVNLSIPVNDGRMMLGTWQGVFLWEHRRAPHRRRLALHLLGRTLSG